MKKAFVALIILAIFLGGCSKRPSVFVVPKSEPIVLVKEKSIRNWQLDSNGWKSWISTKTITIAAIAAALITYQFYATHKYKQTVIQQQEVILDVIGALDIATTFFVFPMISTQVHPINSNFMPQPINFSEEDFRGTLISFANAYIALSNISGFESVQALCLNSFENLRAVISTSEVIDEEARNRLRVLSNDIALRNGMTLQNQW